MTTRTITDLATAVMEDLGVLDATASPSAEDRDLISRRYAEGLEELRDDGLVWWEANAIPYAVFLPVVSYVALLVRKPFFPELPPPSDPELDAAKLRIRRRIARRSTGEQTAFNDY
jgi:hypothetical protein